MSTPSDQLNSFQDGASSLGGFGALEFVLRMTLMRVRTAALVKVKAVTIPSGDPSPIGVVDVTPQVQQVDGLGKVTNLPDLFSLPYFRLQGGSNAVIMDPAVGDLGIAVFCDRDTSAAIAAKQPSPPGSTRHHSLSDGFYLGGFLNGVPTQFVEFTTAGIKIVSPTQITLQAPTIQVNGVINQTGGANTFQGDVTAAGTSTHTHKHGGVQTGSGQTGAPV